MFLISRSATRLWNRTFRLMPLLLLGALVSTAAGAFADPSSTIALESGQSVVISTPGLTRVAVGDKNIAGVVPIGDYEVVVNAKSAGTTSLVFWEDGYRISYEVVVSNQELDRIGLMVKAALDDPHLQYVSFEHSLVVRGTVDDRTEFLKIQDVLSRFNAMATQEKYTIVNAVVVKQSFSDIARQLAIPGATDVTVDADGAGNIMVSGRVQSRQQAEQILQRATSLAGTALGATGKVIDRIEVATVSQVSIKVYVLEIDRTASSQLGLRLQSAVVNSSAQTTGGYSYGSSSFPITEQGCSNPLSCAGKAFNAGPWVRTTLLAPTLDLIMSTGHARILSDPDLVAMPGTAATFLVGGEIPIIYSTGQGQVSIEYKQYGVQLKVTPVILPNGSIEATINPDISDLDYANAVGLGSYSIPALKESSLSTVVIAKPGDSIVLGGLLRRLDQRTITKIPYLSQLPIIGKLFQSVNYIRGDSDVIFVMTPQIVTQ